MVNMKGHGSSTYDLFDSVAATLNEGESVTEQQ